MASGRRCCRTQYLFETLRYRIQHQYQDLLAYKHCVTRVYNPMTILHSLYHDLSCGRGDTPLRYVYTQIKIRAVLMSRGYAPQS